MVYPDRSREIQSRAVGLGIRLQLRECFGVVVSEEFSSGVSHSARNIRVECIFAMALQCALTT